MTRPIEEEPPAWDSIMPYLENWRKEENIMKTYPTPKKIAEELARGRLQPFDAFGKHWQGDIFYSDIYFLTKKMPGSAYQKVAEILRDKGFYVHS